MPSQEDRLAVLAGGLHFKEGKAWIKINDKWIHVPMYDKESEL